jgi:hypothetical protein
MRRKMLQGAMPCTTEARRLKHSLGRLKVLASTDRPQKGNEPTNWRHWIQLFYIWCEGDQNTESPEAK